MGAGIPRFNPLQGGFASSMRTNYGSFSMPEYQETSLDLDNIIESEEDDDDEDDRYSSNLYERSLRNHYQRKEPSKTDLQSLSLSEQS